MNINIYAEHRMRLVDLAKIVLTLLALSNKVSVAEVTVNCGRDLAM